MNFSPKTLILILVSLTTFSHAEIKRNKNRPEVPGVEFKASKAVLKPYLDAIKDPKKKTTEINRLKQLMFIKEDLAKLMATNPYYSKDRKRILLSKHGKLKFVACKYIRANGNQLNLKTFKGRYVKLKWRSIPSKTIVNMINYYLKLKMGFADSPGTAGESRSLDIKTDIADFAMRAALFVEWNLGQKYAKKYIDIVLKYKPSYISYIKEFLPNYFESSEKQKI
jgi:hypothetical protein